MKNLKKTLLIMVSLLAVLALLAGCASEPVAAPDDDSYILAAEGKLTWATCADFPPYEFYEEGAVTGIDKEIISAIADKLGLELVIADMEFDSVVPAVQTGKADIAMAGLSATEERKLEVDFTATYATGVQVIIVKEDSPITSVDDLFAEGADNIVGVQLATTGDIYCSGDIEAAGLGTIDRYSKGADAVLALVSGKVDCVVIDNEPAKVFVASNSGLKILPTEYVEEDYAAGISKDNPNLLAAVDAALQELIADGTVKAIIDTYISAE